MNLRLSIRSKLLLALLAVTLVTSIVTMTLALRLLIAHTSRQADRELLNSGRTVLLTLDLMQAKALADAETMALRDDLGQALVAADRERLVTLTRRVMQERDLDYIIITDAAGIVLARAHAPDRYGDNLSDFVVADIPLHGMTVATVDRTPNEPLFAGGGAPVFERVPPYRLLGAVVAGYALDDAFVLELKTTSGNDVSLLLDTSRLQTTLQGTDGVSLTGSRVADETLLAAVLTTGESRLARIEAGGQAYRAIYAALQGRNGGEPIGVIEIAASEAAVQAAVAQTVRIILFGALIIGFLAVVLAVWLSSRLTRPLLSLARSAAAVGAGDLSQRVDVRSGDEIETLGSAFNQMATGIQQAQADLVASEARYRTLTGDVLDTSEVGISILDKDFRVVWVNQALERYFGLRREEIIGKYKRQLIRERIKVIFEDPETFAERVLATYDDNTYVENFECHVLPDGEREERWLVHWSQPIRTGLYARGRIEQYYDVTSRKRAEEELRKYREHLEELIEERTGELKEKTVELEHANIRLQEADRLKSIFLASMSHELRTPLNSIIGFTGIILQGMSGEINEEQRKQLTLVKNSAYHLLSLINDLLDVSKIEAGKVKLSLEEFRLDEVAREVVETFSPTVRKKNLELLTEAPKGITLFSDRRRIKQVLMNLVSNAVKFTEQGSVKIAARVLRDENLEIRVIDTGIGIKEEDMKRLFQPFQQIDMSLTKKHEGTGLGLYLTKKLVTLLGGDISAKSEYGRGSEFKITLPSKYEGEERNEENTGG